MIVTHDVEKDRYRIKIDGLVDGKRVRKTKLLPRGISLDQAYLFAEKIFAAPVEFTFKDELARAVSGRPKDPGSVYFIKNPNLYGLVKIGMTRSTVHERIQNLSTAHFNRWEIIDKAYVHHPEIVEMCLHRHFNSLRKVSNREFFRMTDDMAMEAALACREIDGIDLMAAISTIGRKPSTPSATPPQQKG